MASVKGELDCGAGTESAHSAVPTVALSSDVQESGRERIMSLFQRRYGDPWPDEVREWNATVITATLVGFVFGGLLGAREAGDRYILMNHSTKYVHPMQAHREFQSAAMLGFCGKGLRLGWRIGLFAAVFSGSKILLSLYRDKEDGLNYIAAGATAGCLYRVNLGVKPAIGGMVLGTLLSIPVGCLMYGAHGLEHMLTGRQTSEARQTARRERKRLWEERMRATDDVISQIQQEGAGTAGSQQTMPTGLSDYYKLDDKQHNKRWQFFSK